MKMSNYQQPNLPNGKSIFSLFRYVIVAILIFSFILITSVRSYAEDPSAAIIRPFGGNNIVVREGTNRNVTPWNRDKNGNLLGKLRGFKDTLEIPGDNKSKANLSFISENTVVVDHGRLMISTVPSSDNTEYRFPCGLARGRITIGWRQAGKSADRACSEGISVGPGVGKLSYRPNLNYRDGLQASKKILLAQSFSDVIVVPPDSSSRFLQAVANENGAEIITLQGDILVKSGKHLQGRLIPEGNQYSYPQDTITPIDKNSIINSPAVQDFLNPNNWLSPDIPQRVADGIAGQLGEMRTALGNGSPAIASNSGNNNNSGQPPLSQSSQRTAPQSTQPQRQAENPSYSYSDRGGYCSVVVRSVPEYPTTVSAHGSPEDPCEYIRLSDDVCSARGENCELIPSTYLLHGQNQVLLSCEGFSQTFVGIGDEPIDQAQLAVQYRISNGIKPYRACIIRVIGSSPQPPQPITP
jgi:hypothetical protein